MGALPGSLSPGSVIRRIAARLQSIGYMVGTPALLPNAKFEDRLCWIVSVLPPNEWSVAKSVSLTLDRKTMELLVEGPKSFRQEIEDTIRGLL